MSAVIIACVNIITTTFTPITTITSTIVATTNLTVWFFPQHPTEQGGWGGTLTFSSLFKASIHQKTGLFPFILTIHQFM